MVVESIDFEDDRVKVKNKKSSLELQLKCFCRILQSILIVVFYTYLFLIMSCFNNDIWDFKEKIRKIQT